MGHDWIRLVQPPALTGMTYSYRRRSHIVLALNPPAT
jgi:hypothetical protein